PPRGAVPRIHLPGRPEFRYGREGERRRTARTPAADALRRPQRVQEGPPAGETGRPVHRRADRQVPPEQAGGPGGCLTKSPGLARSPGSTYALDVDRPVH